MLNQSGIRKENATVPKQILFNVQNQMSVGVVVSAAAGVTVDSKKIVKAGTPLGGDLLARGTAFIAGTATAVQGVLLHDVDVTAGNANGTLLIWGFVNLNRVESSVATLLTSAIQGALAGKVWFLKD